MNEMGFYIGEDVVGRERLRQKFNNLQSFYLKAKQRRKTTTEGEVNLPSFYEELEELLADNHKVNPVLIVDIFLPKKYGPDSNCKSDLSNTKLPEKLISLPTYLENQLYL